MINGIDFSADIYRYGFAIQHQKRYGNNGFTAIDGTELVDLIATKQVVTAACNPLTSRRLSALSEACADEYVAAQYTDPVKGEVRLEMIAEVSAANKSLTVDGVTYWKDIVVSLRER